MASTASPPALGPKATRSLLRAELACASWETFSAVLFVWAIVPQALSSALPYAIAIGSASLLLSALFGPSLIRRGSLGRFFAVFLRTASWPLAVLPLLPQLGASALIAAAGFGLMAGGIRRALYRRLGPMAENPTDEATLRDRLAENAMLAGIIGGHALMLFCVAFLRTESPVLFRAWLQVVPVLALVGTAGFTLAIRPATKTVLLALKAGERGDLDLHRRALTQATQIPMRLSYLNFLVWSVFTSIGVLYARRGPEPWSMADAMMQISLGVVFAMGVTFYQRSWDTETLSPVVLRLRAWTGEMPQAEPITLKRRMLRDFGSPLLFTTTLSLLCSIGLYRALSSGEDRFHDLNAVAALFASFAMMMIAALGVVAKAASELSRPLSLLAKAADRVASGALEAALPPIAGPVEVVLLGERIEEMRVRLAGTIAELEREREGLEQKVQERTKELTKTLHDLKQAQAALVQGERLASIGELFAGVAHEIYNPLTAISGASAPLGRLSGELAEVMSAFRAALPDLPPAKRASVEAVMKEQDVDAALEDLVGISDVIRRASDRAVRIVGNLKSFSRTPGEVVPTDLIAGLEETLMLLGRRLRDAEIEVEKHYEPLPTVLCRSGEASQICMNLLVNAIQALESDSRENRPSPKITIEARREGEMALISITDNGPGVPDDLATHIFEPFFTTKPRGQGTGLGLSISRDIAQRHGGTLVLEKAEGGGARFLCRVPIGEE